MLPKIAIIEQNTLAALGLAALIEEMMPMGEVCIYNTLGDLAKETGAGYNAAEDLFVHYFISAQTLLGHARFFLPRRHKTIVLVQGADSVALPEGFRQIDVTLPRDAMLRNLMMLHGAAHGPMGAYPHASKHMHSHGCGANSQGDGCHPRVDCKPLTRRETDVLRQLVRGLSNKETAESLGVGLTTVITHRDNLARKLGTRSLAALTVYAVSHGIVGVEEI